jgi:hypothetical protein
MWFCARHTQGCLWASDNELTLHNCKITRLLKLNLFIKVHPTEPHFMPLCWGWGMRGWGTFWLLRTSRTFGAIRYHFEGDVPEFLTFAPSWLLPTWSAQSPVIDYLTPGCNLMQMVHWSYAHEASWSKVCDSFSPGMDISIVSTFEKSHGINDDHPSEDCVFTNPIKVPLYYFRSGITDGTLPVMDSSSILS